MTASGRFKVLALAGRRIDAANSKRTRFSLEQVPTVRKKLAEFFKQQGTGLLVSSAACGADLLALDVASSLGVRCQVVLPYHPDKFRRSSVTDRPGEWGCLYDELIFKIKAAGDLVVLGDNSMDELAFRHTNQAIIHIAASAALPERPSAVLIWEGKSHGKNDVTAAFEKLATAAGMATYTILTR